MAILTAKPDGTSDAKAGDIVVTGGGIFRKNADGSSTKLSTLKDYIGKDTTKNYSDLKGVAQSFQAHQSVIGGVSGTVAATNSSKNNTASTQKPAKEDKYTPTSVDDNGIMSGIVGFTPVDYSTGSTASSDGINKVVGYIVLGLVGLAVLDRFVNKGAK